MTTKRNIAIAVAAALGLGLALNAGVLARGPGFGYGGGHMMSGYGHMVEPQYYGRGYGDSPRLGGTGHHMHGPFAYGGGHGVAHHQSGLGPFWALDLSDEQSAKVGEIQDQLRKQHWSLRGELQDKYSELRKLNAAETPDRAAVGAVYDEISKIERQFVTASADAREAAEKLLTEDQKRAFTRARGGGVGPCVTVERQS
ncbi:MAG: Spy/CpxP family protein refolding chaperone [Pseudomonadota bacterium]